MRIDLRLTNGNLYIVNPVTLDGRVAAWAEPKATARVSVREQVVEYLFRYGQMGEFGCVPIRGTVAGKLANTKFHWATESNGIARRLISVSGRILKCTK